MKRRQQSPPLFINLHKRRLCYSSVSQHFRRLLVVTGIGRSEDRHPHLHDLRHTFAVSRLLSWYQADRDVNALLPALANAVVLLHTQPPIPTFLFSKYLIKG